MEATDGHTDNQTAKVLDKLTDRTNELDVSTSNSDTAVHVCTPEVKRKQDDDENDVFSDKLTDHSPVKSQRHTQRTNGSLDRPRALSSGSMTPDGHRKPRRSVTFAESTVTGVGTSVSSRSSSGYSLRSTHPERQRALSLVNNTNMELLPESLKHFSEMVNEDKKALAADVVISTVFVLLYVISVVLNLAVSTRYYDDRFGWFLVILLFTIVPSLVTQIASYILGSRDEHSNDDTITILHLLQLGVLSRYSRLIWKGMKGNRNTVIAQSELLSAVSLFHSFLSVGPQLVFQLFLMVEFNNATPIFLISVCIQAATFAFSLAFHRLELRAELVMKLTRLLAMFLWRFLIISSRVVAIAMFMNEYGVWIVLVLGVQVIAFVLVHMIYARVRQGWLSPVDFLQSIFLSYIHLFCFFNHMEGHTRYRYILYYGCMFMENTMLILLWFAQHAAEWYGVLALCVVWIGFALGLISLFLYYHFLHHSKWESRSIGLSPDMRQQRQLRMQQKEQENEAEELQEQQQQQQHRRKETTL